MTRAGVVFPQIEIGADPVGCRDFAQAAEGLGFDGLMVFDHVLGADPSVRPGWSGYYALDDMFHEPFVLFGHLAAVTERIRFVTAILILPQRQTVLVAKQAAALDVLSNGRFTLGIGVGWNDVEFEALGESFRDRGRRCEEQIDLMRALWTQRCVDYEGRWHRVTAAGINPLPVQQPIPIWVGGEADLVLDRAARIGDGWLPVGKPEGANADMLARVRGNLDEHGRNEEQFTIAATIDLHDQDWDDVASDVAGWRKLGANEIYFDGMKAGIGGPVEHIAAIRAVQGDRRRLSGESRRSDDEGERWISVTCVDANPELEAPFFHNGRVLFRHLTLELKSSSYGFGDTFEFRQNGIPSFMKFLATMRCNHVG